jgi:hypothetical protein
MYICNGRLSKVIPVMNLRTDFNDGDRLTDEYLLLPGGPLAVIDRSPVVRGASTLIFHLPPDLTTALLRTVYPIKEVPSWFMRRWEWDVLKDIRFPPSVIRNFVIICDPLHLLKRIRYRLVALLQLICPEEHFEFFLCVIHEAHILAPVVFNNSRESKMHDSLPLELFSLKTLACILNNPIIAETMMVPWCLLVVALTWPDLSTETRRDLLEIGL